jgi:restriction system protein
MSSPSITDLVFHGIAQNKLVFGLLGLAFLGKAVWPLFKPAVKGWTGEVTVNSALRKLDPQVYRCFKNLYIPRKDEKGLTQIDHVVVSPFGIFVIETKNYAGWIFGSEKDRNWTQCLKGGKKHQFQNPLFQNRLHMNSLAKELSLPGSVFHSVIYFAGDAIFKTPMPDNVMRSGLLGYILDHQKELLDREEVLQVTRNLEDLIAGMNPRAAKREHLEGIGQRFSN